jgi:RimJ/RimL family protein N-acetyltransferase
MSDVTVRKLTAGDADAYRRLRSRGLRESPPAFAESYQEFASQPKSHVVETLEDPAGLSCVFGALDGTGELVGVVGVTRDALEKMRHKGFIWGMYVASEHNGRGIGKQLLKAAIAHARGTPGLEQLRLIVGEANAGARRLYESVGFKPFGLELRELKTEGKYYDSVHMWLDLTGTHT